MSVPANAMSANGEVIRIDVDASKALEVLSGSVFAGVAESIRELIANAADSLRQLPSDLQISPEIRLRADEKSGVLSISDNGVGMTHDEARELLGKLFRSTKGLGSGLIGQFGVGFYSCFRLCTRVEVVTRSRQPGDRGTRLTYSGGETLQLSAANDAKTGTIVSLHLTAPNRGLLRTSALRSLVRQYCNFVLFPIYLGEGPDLANEVHAPWEHPSEKDVLAELERVFDVSRPLAVFPLSAAKRDSGKPQIAGVLFVADPDSEASIRLYVSRVLITEDEKTLLPAEIRAFISGIVDLNGVPLVLSRDGLVQDAPEVGAVREWLINFLSEGLAKLARERRDDFASLQNAYGVRLKEACFHIEELRGQLCNHRFFRSTQQMRTTIPEYLGRSRTRVVIYADNAMAAESLLPLYERTNSEVLYMTDAIDRGLREYWPMGNQQFEFRRLDAATPEKGRGDSKHSATHVSAIVLEQAQELFREVASNQIVVEIKPLGLDGPATILAIDEEARKMVEIDLVVRELRETGRLNELPKELQDAAEDGVIEIMAQFGPCKDFCVTPSGNVSCSG